MKTLRKITAVLLLAITLLFCTACTVKKDGFSIDNFTPIDHLAECELGELTAQYYSDKTIWHWERNGLSGVIRATTYTNFRGEKQPYYYAIAKLEDGYYFFSSCKDLNENEDGSPANFTFRSPVVFRGLGDRKDLSKIRIGMTREEVEEIYPSVTPEYTQNTTNRQFTYHFLDDGSILSVGYDETDAGYIVSAVVLLEKSNQIFAYVSDRDLAAMRR